VELNRLAPDFALPDLEGRLHRLSDFRGRIIVVNFWSADCPWVERVDRELLACLPDWGERVVLVTIAANLNEDDGLVAAAAGQRGLPLVLRGRPEVLDAYAAELTPHLFVVDAEGVLRYAGAFDDLSFRRRTPTHIYLREAVEALLAGRLPDPAKTPAYGCAIVRRLPDSC